MKLKVKKVSIVGLVSEGGGASSQRSHSWCSDRCVREGESLCHVLQITPLFRLKFINFNEVAGTNIVLV